MRIALLGLGRMGRAVGHRLIGTGHDLTVWNRSGDKAGELVAKGATEADTPEAAIGSSDAVFVSLSNDAAVRDLTARIRDALAGRPYLETTTISAGLSAELGASFDQFVALPILGGPQAVVDGHALYLAGGREDVLDQLGAVWDSLGTVKRYARPELASAGKLAVNLLLVSGLATLAEALVVGRAGGLTDEQLTDLLTATPMLAPGLQNRFEGVVKGEGPLWWTTLLAAKDTRLAIEVAESADRMLPVAACVLDLFQQAADSGLDDEDIVAVSRLYRG